MDISSERKRQLKEEYRIMRPDMGVFAVVCRSTGKHFIEAAKDLKGRMNRVLFQLNGGAHPNMVLQRDWQAMGQAAFDIKILEQLARDKDESKTDYDDDLAILKTLWIEKLTELEVEFY